MDRRSFQWLTPQLVSIRHRICSLIETTDVGHDWDILERSGLANGGGRLNRVSAVFTEPLLSVPLLSVGHVLVNISLSR